MRYSPDTLAAELGPAFRIEESERQTHTTPSGATQQFWYCRLRYAGRLPGHAGAPNT